jgi:hypothetical protein
LACIGVLSLIVIGYLVVWLALSVGSRVGESGGGEADRLPQYCE